MICNKIPNGQKNLTFPLKNIVLCSKILSIEIKVKKNLMLILLV